MEKTSKKKIAAFLAFVGGLLWIVFATTGCGLTDPEQVQDADCVQNVKVDGPFSGTINQDGCTDTADEPAAPPCKGVRCGGDVPSAGTCSEINGMSPSELADWLSDRDQCGIIG